MVVVVLYWKNKRRNCLLCLWKASWKPVTRMHTYVV